MIALPSNIQWLHDSVAKDVRVTGGKAARLAAMVQQGLPVPDGFVLTVAAFREGMTEGLEAEARAAYQRLMGADACAVAVRSSATAEDLEGASFAGLQETVLNVSDGDVLIEAIRRVWGSLGSAEATAYREHAGVQDSAMAVLVQRQVAAKVAGVVFGRDPMTGEAALVIEAVGGLGDALVSGEVEPQRWRIERQDGGEIRRVTPDEPLLNEGQIDELVSLVKRVEAVWGGPQDVECAWDGEQFWVLQARPITGQREDWFTEHLPNDHYLWTAAFFNERFTQPVSPLGWTLITEHMERLALRAPLELLGGEGIEGLLVKRWRGHPYTRVEAWQQIYKLFPDALLPEDAGRFFPDGDASLRRAPRRPTYGPRLVANALGVLKANFQGASPLHNPRRWARYEQRQQAALIRLIFRERHLEEAGNPITEGQALMRETATLTAELLELHRWSLLYADLSYSLLRRLLILLYGRDEGTRQAVRMTVTVETTTTQMNRELAGLAAKVVEDEEIAALLKTIGQMESGEGEVGLEAVRPVEPGVALGSWWQELERFMERYGHRFFSLDLYDRPWATDLPAFARFIVALHGGEAGNVNFIAPVSVPAWARPVLELTRAYLRMREAQRFHWQQLLALQRRAALKMGRWWAERGQLERAEDVFGLTWEELMRGEVDGERAAGRMAHLRRLREQARQAPGWHYPDFLRGNVPLRMVAVGAELVGRPVSPGVARGPARIIAHPSELHRAQPGEILVTSSPDPGWTPIFGTVAGMVTERGGQLSHGAVVAREYGLPAVSGIPGLLTLLRDGEMLLVDGTQGIVVRTEGT